MRIGLLFAGVIQQKPEQNTHTYTQYLGWWLLSWRRDSLWNFFALFHQETFQLIDCEGRVAAQVSDAQTQQRISIYETRAGKSRGCCAALGRSPLLTCFALRLLVPSTSVVLARCGETAGVTAAAKLLPLSSIVTGSLDGLVGTLWTQHTHTHTQSGEDFQWRIVIIMP